MGFWRHWVRLFHKHKVRNELRARLDLELLLHALRMRQALQEAEEKVREEIAFRIQAEKSARQEAETRLEIERAARHAAERNVERISGPVYRACPETIAKAQREMMSRVKAEQLAMAGVSSRNM